MELDIIIHDERLYLEQYALGYGTPGSAGIDLRACISEPLKLEPGEVKLIPTGFAIHLDNEKFAAILMPRSGMGHKNGIILGNTLGLIDSDYTGQMQLSLWNRSQNAFVINPMERVAQMVIMPVVQVKLNPVKSFKNASASKRGSGGFNSTGKH